MLYFIVDPFSGAGAGYSAWMSIQKYLINKNVLYEAYMARSPERITDCARDITERLETERLDLYNSEEKAPVTDIIVVVGDDKAINRVLNGITIHARFFFTCIPCGAINDFAHSMQIKKKQRAALKNILAPRLNAFVDYGTVSVLSESSSSGSLHKRFAVSCGIGYDAILCESIRNTPLKKVLEKLHLGGPNFMAIATQELIRFQTSPGYIILDRAKQVNFKNVAFISCLIHRYECGGFKIAPDANFSDGLFEVCVVAHSQKMNMLPVFAAIHAGKHKNMRGVHFYRAKTVKIHMDTPMPVHTDSEVIGTFSDLELSCNQRQLRVLL